MNASPNPNPNLNANANANLALVDPSSPSSQWHSIRPWRPTLSLFVREITSVSATFILSSPLASAPTVSGEAGADEDEDETDEELMVSDAVMEGEEGRESAAEDASGEDQTLNMCSRSRRQTQIVADALSKGLSVKVNGTPWQRVLMRVDEQTDEAVVILFGLMPGRQYDVELGIVPGENILRSQITTELAAVQPATENDNGAIEFANGGDLSHAPQHVLSSSPSSGSAHSLVASGSTPPGNASPMPPAPSFSLEDRRLQLTHTLTQLNNEHAQLTQALKTARREAQKADAALRSEIEVLKRASEKSAGQEVRARQKVLALQEAVRRAVAATKEVQDMIVEVEEMLPGLDVRRREVEGEWEQVRAEAKEVREQREEVEKEERRRLEAMQSEIAGLGNRMEKLGAKREKMEGEGGVLSELEERLKKLEEERLRVENDPYRYDEEANVESTPAVFNDSEEDVKRRRGSVDSRQGDSPPSDQQHSHPPGLPLHPHAGHHQHAVHHHNSHHHPHPRKRHSHPTNSRIPPPSQQQHPIQRPTHNSRLSLPSGPGIIHLNKAQVAPSNPNSQGTSSNTSAASSTLSSRAPPFEPGRRPPLLPTNNSGNPPTSVKSDLNPGSSPFSPRSSGALAAISASQSAPAIPTTSKRPAVAK